MVESMVERVARAIQDKLPGWLAEDGTVEDVDLARAAIEAMRRPTETMAIAGKKHTLYPGRTWADMIDAALAEQQS